MNSTKPCRHMRPALALWVGHDLDEVEEKQVRRHVAECGGCRDFSQRLQGSQHVLEHAGAATASLETPEPSLWPDVRGTLLQRARRSSVLRSPSSGRIQRWLPVGALTAACLTIWFSSQGDLPVRWPDKMAGLHNGFHQQVTQPVMEQLQQYDSSQLPDFSNWPRSLDQLEFPRDFPLNGKNIPPMSLPQGMPSVRSHLDVQPGLEVDRLGRF